MKDFDTVKRRYKSIELNAKSNSGSNPVPFADEYMDNNAINLTLDDAIYRIFSLDKFRKTLQDKKLCLVHTSKWQDPFENFLLNSEGVLNDGTIVGFDNLRDKYYGQCWTTRKNCDGLWRNYKGTEPSAIKVKSSVGILMRFLYDFTNIFHELSYFIGKVDYVSDENISNYFQNEIDFMNFQSGVELVQTLLVKREAFSYEEEVRIIFSKPSSDEIDLTKIKNPWDNSPFFFVEVNPNILFEEIEIDPWLPLEEFKKLKEEFRTLGYTGSTTQSSLYNKPFFRAKLKG